MSTYSNRLQPALQNLLQHVVRYFHPRSSCLTHISADVCSGRKSLVKPVTRQNISSCSVLSPEIVIHDDAYIGGRLQRTKITRKAGDAAEYIELFGSFTRNRHARRRIYWRTFRECIKCVVHDDLGWKNQITRCNRFWRAGCSRLEYVDIRLVY